MNPTEFFFFSQKVNNVKALVDNFKTRVLADSGTFESDDNLINWTKLNRNLYDRSSILLTPNGVKTSKIYSFKGPDFSFARATTGTRINSGFNQEVMAINMPRIDYEHGVPTILHEGQTTNLILNSTTPVTQTVTVGITKFYSLSFFGTGTVIVSGGYTETVVGTSLTVKRETLFGGVVPTTTSVILTITGDVRFANFAESFSLSFQPSSHVPTTGSIITRTTELGTEITGISAILAQPYICYIEFITTNQYYGKAGSYFQLKNSSNHYVGARSDTLVYANTGAGDYGLISGVLGPAPYINRDYGKNARFLLYVNPITNELYSVGAVFNTSLNTWKQVAKTQNLASVLPVGLDKLTIGTSPTYQSATFKLKKFAVISDFTGITNINAYMQDLAIYGGI